MGFTFLYTQHMILVKFGQYGHSCINEDELSELEANGSFKSFLCYVKLVHSTLFFHSMQFKPKLIQADNNINEFNTVHGCKLHSKLTLRQWLTYEATISTT
jgi:hypothetical protein